MRHAKPGEAGEEQHEDEVRHHQVENRKGRNWRRIDAEFARVPVRHRRAADQELTFPVNEILGIEIGGPFDHGALI
jgi:hypothetical protein